MIMNTDLHEYYYPSVWAEPRGIITVLVCHSVRYFMLPVAHAES